MIMILTASAAAQDCRYAIIEITPPHTRTAYCWAVNDPGSVAGNVNDEFGHTSAFVWRDGIFNYLMPLSQDLQFSQPRDINDAGEVAGSSYLAFGIKRAVRWDERGVPLDLGTFGGSESAAYGINESGDVVGRADLPDGGLHPFLWRGDGLIDLGDLGRASAGAKALNDLTQVVGASGGSAFRGSRAFLWDDGLIVNLGSFPDDRDSHAQDINDSGLVVGDAFQLGMQVAVVWEDREIRSIHNSQIGRESAASAVNDFGQIVGLLDVDGNFIHTTGFLYDGSGPMVDLMTLLPPHNRWRQIVSAFDINNHGEIATYGDLLGGNDGDYRGALLTPVHPTLTLQGPQPGRAGTLNGMRVTGCTPGARVHFYYSTHGGGTLVPGCNHTDGVTLQLENPIRAGSATANANGVATLTRFIPRQARDLGEVLIQAVDVDDCQISQLVVVQFE